MAYANTGKLSLAEKELEHLLELKETDAVKNLMIWEINAASDICNIAELVLKAEIALKGGEAEKAIAYLKEAVTIEDQLNYNEPPDWFFSVRHHLGEVYMEEGKYAEAEAIYREDLTYWVKNGYALNGLYHSLAMQKKDKEADEIKIQFEEAWKHADSKLKYSRLDASDRKNLALRIDNDSPDNLIFVADVMCMK
jgi:tetratricopeptide (TPR) repeat protein